MLGGVGGEKERLSARSSRWCLLSPFFFFFSCRQSRRFFLLFAGLLLFSFLLSTLISLSFSSSSTSLTAPLPPKNKEPASETTTTTTTTTSSIFELLPFPTEEPSQGKDEFARVFTHRPSSLRTILGELGFDEECDVHQGYGLLETWKRKALPYCNSEGRSRRMEQVWPKPKPFYFFDMRNIRLDAEQLKVFADCPEGDQLNRLDLTHQYLKTITHRPRNNNTEDLGLGCVSWLRGATLVVWQTTHNFYHSVEALFGAFQSLYMVGYSPSEVRVLFAQPTQLNHKTDVELHRRLFGGLVDDLQKEATTTTTTTTTSKQRNYCLEHAVFGLTASAGSVLPNSFWINTACTNQSNIFIQDVSNYIVSRILETSPSSNLIPSSKPLIVLVLRKDYYGTSQPISRKLDNEDELKQSIEGIVRKHPKLSTQVEFRAVDMAQLTVDKQLSLMRDTCVLIGVHGAGLTHTLFMGRNGDSGRSSVLKRCPREVFKLGPALIEISPYPEPGRIDNKVFNIFWNLAAWSQVHHIFSPVLHHTGMQDRNAFRANVPHVLQSLTSLLVDLD